MAKRKIGFETAEEIRTLRRQGVTMVELQRRYALSPPALRDLIHERTYVRILRVRLSAAAWTIVREWARAVGCTPDEFAGELLEHAAQ
jgi:predicted dehydrogenase